MTRPLLHLALVLSLGSGCATFSSGAPRVDAEALRERVAEGDASAARELAEAIASGYVSGGDLAEADELLVEFGPGLRPSDFALHAMILEERALHQRAFDRWNLLVADEGAAPWLRQMAARRAKELVDRVRLEAFSERLSPHLGFRHAEVEVSDLLDAVGRRLESRGLVDRAKALVLSPALVHRSGRIGAWVGGGPLESRWDAVAPARGRFVMPDDGAGVYAATFEVPASTIPRTLEIETGASLTVFLGDQELGRNDRWSAIAPERSRWVLPPGEKGVVRLVMDSLRGAFGVRVLLVPLSDGAQLEPSSGRSLVDRIARLEAALYSGDIHAAEVHSRSLVDARSGVAARILARHLEWDPTLAAERTSPQSRQWLADAIEHTGSMAAARAELILMELSSGHLGRARALRGGSSLGDASDEVDLAVARETGDAAAVLRLSKRLLAARPHSCRAAVDWVESHWERLIAGSEKEPGLWPACPEVLLRRARLALEGHRGDMGAEHARRVLATSTAGSLRLEAALLYSEALWRQGKEAEAVTWASQFTEGREEGMEQMLDWLVRHGAPSSVGRWEERLRHHPGAPKEMWANTLGREHVGLPLSDGAAITRQALGQPRGTEVEDASVEVLFQERFIRVLDNGTTIHRHHQIFRIHGQDALDRWGEVPLPDGAEVLVARTWRQRPSGTLTAIESEDWLATGAISLTGLEGGAIAEVAVLWIEAADPLLAPVWATSRHSLGFRDAVVRRGRVVLVHPVEMPVRVESGGDVRVSREPGRLVAEAHDVVGRPEEPLDPRPELRHPWVRFSGGPGGGLMSGLWHAVESKRAQRSVRGTPTVRAVADQVTGDLVDERARLAALHRYVLDEIQDEASSLGAQEASIVLSRGAGERAVALVSLCRAAGHRCDLVLARPLARGVERPHEQIADVHDWVYPIVRASTEAGTVWLDTASAFAPFDFVPPMIGGVEGLVLHGEGARVRLPEARPGQRGSRRVKMEVRVRADASFEAHGDEALTGLYAMSWRHVLADFGADERRQALGRLIQASLPGAALERLEFEGLDHDAASLQVRWTATGSVHMDQDSARLSLGLSPENLSRATVHLAERETPLLISRSTDLLVELTLEASPGWRPEVVPAAVELDAGLVRYSRTAARDGARLQIQKRCQLAVGLVLPEDYTEWVHGAREIDRSDRLELRFTRSPQ